MFGIKNKTINFLDFKLPDFKTLSLRLRIELIRKIIIYIGSKHICSIIIFSLKTKHVKKIKFFRLL